MKDFGYFTNHFYKVLGQFVAVGQCSIFYIRNETLCINLCVWIISSYLCCNLLCTESHCLPSCPQNSALSCFQFFEWIIFLPLLYFWNDFLLWRRLFIVLQILKKFIWYLFLYFSCAANIICLYSTKCEKKRKKESFFRKDFCTVIKYVFCCCCFWKLWSESTFQFLFLFGNLENEMGHFNVNWIT